MNSFCRKESCEEPTLSSKSLYCRYHFFSEESLKASIEEIAEPHGNAVSGRFEYGINAYYTSPDESINHPPHYTQNPSGVECIDVTEHMSFNLGNAVKYIWRSGLKDKWKQDLEKAIWYIQREIKRLEKANKI